MVGLATQRAAPPPVVAVEVNGASAKALRHLEQELSLAREAMGDCAQALTMAQTTQARHILAQRAAKVVAPAAPAAMEVDPPQHVEAALEDNANVASE